MKKHLLHILLFFCITQLSYSQDDGVMALSLPVRNSLRFNKYAINPTFSFVREQNKYISFTNKRQWVQFDNAPLTYLISYNGRLKENIGVGLGLFQQDYGVLSSFGGVVNFAYNAVLNRDNNLTFGINLGYYQSGLNTGKVIINTPDASLNNIPSSSVVTINPGINYGTTFFDFGVSVNNAVSYNLNTSEILEDNPEQSFQGHIMYTGYMNTRGFFDDSKFSGLIRSEFKKEVTVISGIMMLTVPKGIWGQVGYNSLFGASAGLGLNITEQIALEYNYEQSIGNLSAFGNSHEITLAYRFKNKARYIYSGDDREEGLLSRKNKKRVAVKRNAAPVTKEDRKIIAKRKEEARLQAIEKARIKAETRARLVAEAKAKRDAKIKEFEDKKANTRDAAKIKLAEEAKEKAEEAKAKAEEQAKIKLAEEVKAKAEEQAKIKLAEEVKAKAEEQAKIKLAEEAKAKIESEPIISKAKDDIAISLISLQKSSEESNIKQRELLKKLTKSVGYKQQTLNELKEENDLSEQGIVVAPKAFKSISAENTALETVKLELDNVINSQSKKITELEALYKTRLKKIKNKNDVDNIIFDKAIKKVKLEQAQTINSRDQLITRLASIKVATDIERKRRIKRAAYDNEEDRYIKGRAALERIKKFTNPSAQPLTEADFDFGEKQSSNIQIVKDVKNVDSGYYLVVAVHDNEAKRDEFLRKAIAAGETNINFFYDVTSSKYFIYYNKYDYINEAQQAMQTKGSKPYNGNMSMVKIEN